ncbi:hypothetical protein Cni_G13378 [Canna indica]|uniref:Uncharacterized protein n=1 Tax=Canna indica TaxID=4628 RepID=A0AAQ3Q9T0_9LILI|nr:hypothetical protein Cni_G13378 [Canna indica]
MWRLPLFGSLTPSPLPSPLSLFHAPQGSSMEWGVLRIFIHLVLHPWILVGDLAISLITMSALDHLWTALGIVEVFKGVEAMDRAWSQAELTGSVSVLLIPLNVRYSSANFVSASSGFRGIRARFVSASSSFHENRENLNSRPTSAKFQLPPLLP